MSSQVESPFIRFDDGSGVLARSPPSVVEPQLAARVPRSPPSTEWSRGSARHRIIHARVARASAHHRLRLLPRCGTLNLGTNPPKSNRSLRGGQREHGPPRLARHRRDLHGQGRRRADGWRRVLRHRRRARTGRAGGPCGVREVRRPRPRRASGTQSPNPGAGRRPSVEGAVVQAGTALFHSWPLDSQSPEGWVMRGAR